MDTVELHRQATKAARTATMEKYGRNAVPTVPGTEQHSFWLSVFDQTYTNAIIGWAHANSRMEPIQ